MVPDSAPLDLAALARDLVAAAAPPEYAGLFLDVLLALRRVQAEATEAERERAAAIARSWIAKEACANACRDIARAIDAGEVAE
jgi:hypothetical protein